MPANLPPDRSFASRTMRVERPASDLVLSGRERERAGCIPEAIERYEAAIAQAEKTDDHTVLTEALRRLAVVLHQRDDRERARALCNRSLQTALSVDRPLLAGEALNTLGVMDLKEGRLLEARETFLRALDVGGDHRELRTRVERNLGVVANIRGELDEAMERYTRSVEDSESIGDEHGCAIAYHNLGMLSFQRSLHDDAERFFARSLEIAERAGDVLLQGQCLVNHADVHVARQRYEQARRNAEASLVIFDQLGVRDHKAVAYRVIGIVYRETGRLALAESRLRSSIDLSVQSGSVLAEAEATRELAVVYQTMGRNQAALTQLNAAHNLFSRLDARIDLINVGGKVAELEGTYFRVVREWGQSIESSDSYTFGHCERVAGNAVAVAKALGLDEQEVTTIRLGAYLHDVGKVNVPHEILNKPGPLTRDELEVIQMHPAWGIELLENVEFPWDIKPVIRWHHEKYDGTGYPDRLRGEEIPISAQVVGIVDVYDALTTTRSYRASMTPAAALAEMTRVRGSWSAPVFEAFLRLFGEHEGVGPDRGPAIALESAQPIPAPRPPASAPPTA